jgi:hypothetical protein
LISREYFRSSSIFQFNLAHRIALKANGLTDAAVTVAPEITDFTVEPAEFVAVTANNNFFLATVAGTTKLTVSKFAINAHVVGIGAAEVILAVVGQEYHL